jgi:hypothetical protein
MTASGPRTELEPANTDSTKQTARKLHHDLSLVRWAGGQSAPLPAESSHGEEVLEECDVKSRVEGSGKTATDSLGHVVAGKLSEPESVSSEFYLVTSLMSKPEVGFSEYERTGLSAATLAPLALAGQTPAVRLQEKTDTQREGVDEDNESFVASPVVFYLAYGLHHQASDEAQRHVLVTSNLCLS